MGRAGLALALLVIAAPAMAQEPVGCDKFKWPLERERALLTQAPPAKSGGDLAPGSAVKLALVPGTEVKFAVPPTRLPKEGSYAGILTGTASSAGTYRVTLSAAAWIEVVQDGQLLKSGDFSGVTGCDGLRKSVKFTLGARPFIIELTGVTAPNIGVAVTPD